MNIKLQYPVFLFDRKDKMIYVYHDDRQMKISNTEIFAKENYRNRTLIDSLGMKYDLRSLQRTDYPPDLDNRSKYTACSIHFGQQISLPSTTNRLFDFLDDNEQDSDRFFDVLDSLKQNKLFGYADDIQGEMEHSLFDDDDTEESKINPDDWILLLVMV